MEGARGSTHIGIVWGNVMKQYDGQVILVYKTCRVYIMAARVLRYDPDCQAQLSGTEDMHDNPPALVRLVLS